MILTKSINHFYHFRLNLIRRLAGDRAIPLWVVKNLRSGRLYQPGLLSSLFPSVQELVSTENSLNNVQLRTYLRGFELGWWTLGAKSINYLEKLIAGQQVRKVLEFGSGISTLCLAYLVASANRYSNSVHILSVEQDLDQLDRTQQLLVNAGLQSFVRILFAPITEQTFFGKQTPSYLLQYDFNELIDELCPELILIDGPSGPPGCRLGIIPQISRQLRRRAMFVMDDALRDPEIEIAVQWQSLSNISVHGIVFVDKGLLLGEIAEPLV